jgi:hypothetical protein
MWRGRERSLMKTALTGRTKREGRWPIIGGALVLAGLYSSVQTFDLAREGQITDRYTKAIEQLGAVQSASAAGREGDDPVPLVELRLGAIYALEPDRA